MLKTLPSGWVDRIFARLTLTYGQEFLRRYEGLPMDEVKADWALQLGGYVSNPQAIAFALESLPADRAPTVLQFAELCRRAPVMAPPALPAPAPDPVAAKAALSAVQGIARKPAGGSRSWAEALRERELRGTGRKLTKFQREAWREVLLGEPITEPAQ